MLDHQCYLQFCINSSISQRLLAKIFLEGHFHSTLGAPWTRLYTGFTMPSNHTHLLWKVSLVLILRCHFEALWFLWRSLRGLKGKTYALTFQYDTSQSASEVLCILSKCSPWKLWTLKASQKQNKKQNKNAVIKLVRNDRTFHVFLWKIGKKRLIKNLQESVLNGLKQWDDSTGSHLRKISPVTVSKQK